MKVFVALFLCLVVAAYVVDAIPNNCLPCTTDYRIICKDRNSNTCMLMLSNTGQTSRRSDYTAFASVTCTDVQSGYNKVCVAGKLDDAVLV